MCHHQWEGTGEGTVCSCSVISNEYDISIHSSCSFWFLIFVFRFRFRFRFRFSPQLQIVLEVVGPSKFSTIFTFTYLSYIVALLFYQQGVVAPIYESVLTEQNLHRPADGQAVTDTCCGHECFRLAHVLVAAVTAGTACGSLALHFRMKTYYEVIEEERAKHTALVEREKQENAASVVMNANVSFSELSAQDADSHQLSGQAPDDDNVMSDQANGLSEAVSPLVPRADSSMFEHANGSNKSQGREPVVLPRVSVHSLEAEEEYDSREDDS